MFYHKFQPFPEYVEYNVTQIDHVMSLPGVMAHTDIVIFQHLIEGFHVS